MNVPLVLGAVTLFIVALAIFIEAGRLRTSKRRRKTAAAAPPRRLVHLEERMLAAFTGPRESYGPIFAEFSIWRQLDNTRMDIRTKSEWKVLNLFTRSLIIRHLWRSLSGLVKDSATVNVDLGARDCMIWTEADTENFNDCGVAAPWVKRKGKVGTLVSGD